MLSYFGVSFDVRERGIGGGRSHECAIDLSEGSENAFTFIAVHNVALFRLSGVDHEQLYTISACQAREWVDCAYLALIDHDSHHASALPDLNVLNVNLPACSAGDSLVEAIVKFWECRIALFVAECMYVGVNVGFKVPITCTWQVRRVPG
jgi:hypothetical protein